MIYRPFSEFLFLFRKEGIGDFVLISRSGVTRTGPRTSQYLCLIPLIYQIVLGQTLFLNTLWTYHARITGHPVAEGTDRSFTPLTFEESIVISSIMTAVRADVFGLLPHSSQDFISNPSRVVWHVSSPLTKTSTGRHGARYSICYTSLALNWQDR